MVQLDSIEEAIAYLQRLRGPIQDLDLDVSFGGELGSIRFLIDGPEFHHSVTGELSRGLVAYQDEIYKAAKFALYGREGRFQLSQEQRKSFELIFEVKEGSTDLIAPINEIAKGLAAGIANLEPAMLTGVLITVVLILTTAYVGVKILSTIHDTKQKKDVLDAAEKQSTAMQELTMHALSQQAAIALELKQSRQDNPVVKKFEQAQSDGVKEVLKSVPTATVVTVGGVTFDSDDVRELRRRSPRAKSEYLELVDDFRVFVDTATSPTRLTLSGTLLPGEFNADLPDDLAQAKADFLWATIRAKGTVSLEIGATIIREKVRSAVILDVNLPDDKVRLVVA